MGRIRKKESKRQSTKQRVKVQKKVKEHQRKQRRDAKRNPQWKSRRRQDPGIPNSFPYKEELLNEIDEKRRLAAEERMARPDVRDAEETDDMDDEAEVEEAVEEADEAPMHVPYAAMLRSPLNTLVANRDKVEALVFVLDARDPSTFRSAWLEQSMSKKSPALVYVLNKADLVPAEVLTAWLYRLLVQGHAAFPVCVPSAQWEESRGIDVLANFLQPLVKGAAVAVLGLQHVGKSAVATALQGTFEQRGGQEQVFDTPALVPSSSPLPVDDDDESEEEREDPALALAQMETARNKLRWILMRNQGKMQRFKDPSALVRVFLERAAHPEDLMLKYSIPAFGSFVPVPVTASDDAPVEDVLLEQSRRLDEKAQADTQQFLISVARSVGRLKRHGVPDATGAARILLRDWSQDGFGYYAKPLDSAKAVQAQGSKADKARWSEAEKKVAHLAGVVLPRRQWREQRSAHELRLTPLEHGPLEEEALSFAPLPEDEDEAETEEEDVPVYASDDEEEVEELIDADDDIKASDSDEEMDEPEPLTAKRNARANAPTKAKPKPGEAYDLNAYF
ncbi:hypothetical protein MVES1_002680 [Malassezia vespertilionis]|uniref:Guanine nucleotide-binding protein-like 3 N-terminal domain-containing protein n=1 Tax=Malassezia vespertilionis TaxID=2020962 RepID=A0A2N1JA79_9BASI|nr:uncharacterized protein MVES1_002680 [Malassezia vespertilionis]PKI83469.1 hypothetical protein MVES_002529 [Malassezia vespertilionis]WFD07317.1 hypothetical protein MVES1_002680 [Malassezia vespertilionis]